MPDYEMIRKQLSSIAPFNNHVGVEILSIADGESTAQLTEAPERMNHIATQHAGALFTLGEAASGAAMTGALLERMASLRSVAAEAKIAYQKIARGTITARAKLNKATTDIFAEVDKNGKALFDVNIALMNEKEQQVAEMTVAWHVKAL